MIDAAAQLRRINERRIDAAAQLRRINERRIVARLTMGTALSRAELAAATGLSAPTVGKVADDLLARGILEEPPGSPTPGSAPGSPTPGSAPGNLFSREAPPDPERSAAGPEGETRRQGDKEWGNSAGTPSPCHPLTPSFRSVPPVEAGSARTASSRSLGRPARPLRLESVTPRFIAVQLGVRHTRIAPLAIGASPREHWPMRFKTPKRGAAWQNELLAVAEKLGALQPWAVLLSVPGVVDEAAKRVLLSPNLHWTEQADMPRLVERVWPVPVVMVQEIRALALGQLAAEPALRDFLLVDVGDGVGAALVRDGRLYHGALPLSGELGHTPVNESDRPCGCGAAGCVETLISRSGLRRSWKEACGHDGRGRVWRDLVAHVRSNGVEPWLRASLTALGRVIAGAINVAGVRDVVVTGALAELPAAVVEVLGETVSQAAMWGRFGEVRVTAAPRRRAAGLVAAGIDRVVLPLEDDARLQLTG